MTIHPIFLFSLPRSGSTLLQRLLGSHEDIATTAEPWLLLPYLYTLRETGVYAEYGHRLATVGIADLCQGFPRGVDDYLAEMRCFVLSLYAKAAGYQSKYFLDKTPRYHLVAEEVIRLFPDGKFLFLWRNPLSIIASMMNTWGRGRWNLYLHKVDLFDGLTSLTATYRRHASQACAVRYEDLVADPAFELQRVMAYLDLPFDSKLLSGFDRSSPRGQLGDSVGTVQYHTVSREPSVKWKHTLTNPIRKAWCRRYLEWVGDERLALMGYNMDLLVSELDELPSTIRFLGSDAFLAVYGALYCMLEPTILKHKLEVLPAWHRIHKHG